MSPHLSKTRYLAGLQCAKRLWLMVHERDAATPPDPGTEAVLELGQRIGRRAHELFPGGVLVEEGARRHDEALAETRALLADASVPAIFEAVVEHGGVRVHADVLERLEGGAFGLREVKASTKVHPHHLHDVAVQRWVLEGAGLRVPSVELVHVDREYVRGPEGVEARRLFRREDIVPRLEEAAKRVPEEIAAQHRLLACERVPEVAPGAQCRAPFACEFWEYCTAGKPDDWIYWLPRAGARFERLRELGVERIGQIPEDFSLTELQARVREAHRTSAAFVAPELADALEALGPPAFYLDFETMGPAEPLYCGTRPYQRLPFQWSLHRVGEDGQLTHRAFLAEGREDPRRAVAEALLAAVGEGSEPVLVWSRFEAGVLGELAAALPDLARPLCDLRARLRDLYDVVRLHVYEPGFCGSFSIKDVAPVLAPGFGWEDLAQATGIAEGAAAGAAFEAIAAGEVGSSDEARIREALLAYCERDTLAMVQVHRTLRKLAGHG